MRKVKRLATQFLILIKRLLRKPSFVAIVVLVPLLILAMSIASGGEDVGVITVALAMRDENDATAREIVSNLADDRGLIRFKTCTTPEDAVEMLKNGKADAAWIFAEGIQERIDKFSKHTHKNNAFVAVVQREDNVFLRLSREKLNTVIYPYLSTAIYRNYVSDSLIKVSELSKEELESFYHAVNAEGEDLFDFAYANREGAAGRQEETGDEGFLVSPLRGLLAVMVVIAGIAATMFYIQDDDKGVFNILPRGTGFSFCVIYHAAAVAIAGLAVFAALLLSRMTVDIVFELGALSLYCLCTVGFCICLRFIISDIRFFGAVTPIIVISTAVLCPIFFPPPALPVVQYMLPTYYYLASLTDINHLWYMLLYGFSLYGLAFALYTIRMRKPKLGTKES